MMSSCDNEASSSLWTSLFLPVEGNVVFASFITPLYPMRQQQQDEEQSGRHREFSNDATDVHSDMGQANTMHDSDWGETRSPLFALCGERADTIVCVLANCDVVFFDMTDGWQGPKEIRRFCGTKGLRGFHFSEAKCVSLIPLDVAYMCRVTATRRPQVGTAPSESSAVAETKSDAMKGGMSLLEEGTMYLRGVVGSSDGRVDVFCENGYVFGFVAHDTEVVGVSAIYSCSDSLAGNNNDISSYQQQGGITLWSNRCGKWRNFDDATANLGFVTCGADGVVYVWKRHGRSLKPKMFDKSACFSRSIKWHVVQPSSRDWLLDGMGAPRVPLLVYTTPGVEHKLRIRSTMTFEDVEASVELPGGCFTRTTAVVSDGEIALVARGKEVYRVIFAGSDCELLFTARYAVTGLYMTKGSVVAAATCDKKGLMYILTLDPPTVLGFYPVRTNGNIRSVALHPASQIVTVVGGDGVVEVVKMPDDWSAALDGGKRGSRAGKTTAVNVHKSFSDVADAIPAVRVLCCLSELQEERADDQRSTLSDAQQVAAQEELLLARMAVPKETKRYLHIKSEVI